MQVWTPSADVRRDGEFGLHLNPGNGRPFVLIYLSEDTLTALCMQSASDCDRLIDAAAGAKKMLLGDAGYRDCVRPEPAELGEVA
jgi:hypothetical protein